MLCSGFAFRSWQMPHAQEKCNTPTKALCVPGKAELVDLLRDSKTNEGSLDQAASLPVPAKW
jgi:hypothetical protein